MAYIVLIATLAAVGIINTAYLSYHSITKKPVTCLFFPPEWCQKVQSSKFSKTLGIPNSMAGFAIYLAIFVLSLLYFQGEVSFTPIRWLIVIGFAFSMHFTLIQAFVLRAFCTWCVLSAIDFTLMFIILFS
ncbi:MAG: hypothetical protein A3J48_00145 [Candidatus Doudnabacteria bacterium RIFCSPHIGHO2_02_FULL_46_11]|uniref:Vitamin K epoxide reductase domain-containing protein n=1 Tax=Candidatus Doudnabacteria bacterium RIFCSPHIGHO2_02_FULL_46_11 TaxID=1817832 RepID=A0A1F5P9G7_9BACT|nr:MAG: hypothetical protein A3J48_00145 [Candidatus Doudnabacteria bacterium RIFCSPHIGHO2_02_FULL_46_11]